MITTPVDIWGPQLRNDYLPPYKAAVDAGAASVMSAFNSLNEVPASEIRTCCSADPAPGVGIRRHGGEQLPGGGGTLSTSVSQRMARMPRGSR